MQFGIFISLIAFILLVQSQLAFCEQGMTRNILLFSRYTNGYWQIWSKDLQSQKESQLTFSEKDKRNPQCLADQNKILYKTANAQIIAFNLADQNEQRLLADFEEIMDFRVSVDGKKIVFSRERKDLPETSDIWMSDISGQNVQILTNLTGIQLNPVISPDQSKVAFISQNQEHQSFDLKLIDLKKGEIKNRIYNGRFHFVPSFSPDGEYLVFSGNDYDDYDIWKYSVRTTFGFQLTENIGLDTSPVFSRDGKKIYFVSLRNGQKQIWVMNADGTNQVAVTTDHMDQDPMECAQKFTERTKSKNRHKN